MPDVGEVPLWEGLWEGLKRGKMFENLIARPQACIAVAVVKQVVSCIPL